MTKQPFICNTATFTLIVFVLQITELKCKNNILTLLFLAIMTKNHSCWSSLVQHSHFLSIILVSFSIQFFKLSKCKQYSCIKKV